MDSTATYDGVANTRQVVKGKKHLKLLFPTTSNLEFKMRNGRESNKVANRVAARREKRLRKSDEKKQRKLNATILRRMVISYDLRALLLLSVRTPRTSR